MRESNPDIAMKLPRRSLGASPRREAFTRIDLAVLILIACLGGAVAAPLFTSHSRARSDTLVCQANLSAIGRAYEIWGIDHDSWPPFMVPQAEGGLRQHQLAANAYIQFSILSNGLSSPKVLVCPADTNTVRRAKDFSINPDGGLMNPGYANNAVSYMVSFHAQRYMPRSIISGDRNIEPRNTATCSYAAFPCQAVNQGPSGASKWGDNIHGGKGNLVFTDGSAEETSTAQLRAAVATTDDVPGDIGGTIHVLPPK